MTTTTQIPDRKEVLRCSREELVRTALLLNESCCLMEDRALEVHLEMLCNLALCAGDDSDIEAALSVLKRDNSEAYDHLLSVAEECAQTVVDENGASVLLMIPILAWSRYNNFYGRMDDDMLVEVADCVRDNFATPHARVTVSKTMLTTDHIPDSFRTVRGILDEMRCGKHGDLYDLQRLIGTRPPPDFADTRYIVCAVSAPAPSELFRSPLETIQQRARAMMDFCLEMHNILEFTMIGSVFEVEPPSAFFSCWRNTEASMRIWSCKALVDFVSAMNYAPGEVTASLAIFVPGAKADDEQMPELRIGLSARNDPEHVIAGLAWPLVREDYDRYVNLARDILDYKGIAEIIEHEQSFPLEWCEDCGSPLYATPTGLVVHVELPEARQGIADVPPTLN